MSWFGETIGERLTTLKGQISKITKEVLAEDDQTESEVNEGSDVSVKELVALCESKDLEIASLKDEFSKLVGQYKFQIESLKNENRKYERSLNGDGDDKDNYNLEELKNELIQVKGERDYLKSCLDMLDSEHQVNIDKVISSRDTYKKELEELKQDYHVLKSEFQILLKRDDFTSDESEMRIGDGDGKINVLKNTAENLNLQLKRLEKEKTEVNDLLISKTQDCVNLNEELKKLKNEMQDINKEKSVTDKANENIKVECENLAKTLEVSEKKHNEILERLKILENENQVKEQEISKLKSLDEYWVKAEEKLKHLVQNFDTEFSKNDSTPTSVPLDKLIDSIENKLNMCKKEEKAKSLKIIEQITKNFRLEIDQLKEQNSNLQNDIKSHMEKWAEKERKNKENKIAAQHNQEEAHYLKLRVSELEKLNEDHCQSQTDDVKRLEQEVNRLLNLCEMKTHEITKLGDSKHDLEEELWKIKSKTSNMEEQLTVTKNDVNKLEEIIQQLKNTEEQLKNEQDDLEKKNAALNCQNLNLTEENARLRADVEKLEKQLSEFNIQNNETLIIQKELTDSKLMVDGLQNTCADLQIANTTLKNECENLKAQVIIRETNLSELLKSNAAFQEEINELHVKNSQCHVMEKEVEKWKIACVDLEIQNQDFQFKIEGLEHDCLKLKSDLELMQTKDNEILQLKQANANLIDSCNRLHYELENKVEAEQSFIVKESEASAKLLKNDEIIGELQEQNKELQSRIKKFQEQMKIEMLNREESDKQNLQQHRRSKSAVDSTLSQTNCKESEKDGSELLHLKEMLQQEQSKYRELYNQFIEITEKEGNAKKEFERLKEHLIEVEDHYTEEGIKNVQIINELKSKVMAAEEQLKNSSTLYTSVKVRDNQHLETLQNQVRLITAQRDDLQKKLSAAEDEIQKHKASLTSLQIVLEQFQQDKDQEIKGIIVKYEKQIKLGEDLFRNSQLEMDGLQKQLMEAKNGLKAASRLGEQLEKKSKKVEELEGNLNILTKKVTELENDLKLSNQSNSGKVDISLIKNLLLGYFLSPKADRKAQVLRIMASVLEFDQNERDKIGVDATSSTWLGNILQPKTGHAAGNESLSEAFIKFLENESRPQPQLKLLPEHYNAVKSKPSGGIPKSVGMISELVLPTFNTLNENESSIILKDVLKDNMNQQD